RYPAGDRHLRCALCADILHREGFSDAPPYTADGAGAPASCRSSRRHAERMNPIKNS
ncbi:hypothetical protein EOD29_34435, partial [Mesorhizobium sp. M1A.T.Ca.IN.004.03.1.1]